MKGILKNTFLHLNCCYKLVIGSHLIIPPLRVSILDTANRLEYIGPGVTSRTADRVAISGISGLGGI